MPVELRTPKASSSVIKKAILSPRPVVRLKSKSPPRVKINMGMTNGMIQEYLKKPDNQM